MTDSVTVVAPVSFRKWHVPGFAQPAQAARPRQDGPNFNSGIAVSDLPQAALDELAAAWLTDLYAKAAKTSPWERQP